MAQLQATLKAQYYPTDLRIVNFLNYIHFPLKHKNTHDWDYKEKYLNPYIKGMRSKTEFKFKKDWYKIPDYNTYYFQKALNENNIQYLYDNFEYFNHFYSNCLPAVILDPMCGKAEWLTSHKKFRGINDTYTIGIELVKERADECKKNKVSLLYNDAYENIEFPEESISILYFNPPYDSIKLDDGKNERLTQYYLKDILDKNILAHEGYVDLVIREDDFIDCLDFLFEHFQLDTELIFKAPQDEYNKFKQIIVIAKKRTIPISKIATTEYSIKQALNNKLSLSEYVKNAPVMDLTKISINKLIELRENISSIDIDKKLKLFKQKKESLDMCSNSSDMVWNWFKGKTTAKENQLENLTVALPLKTGEMSNMLASGMLNGLVAKGTKKNHIVVGGVEQTQGIKTAISYDGNDNKTEIKYIQKINKPYLNILTAEGKIIKLINKTSNITESEDERVEK